MLRRNWLLTYIVGGKIEGRAEVTERRGRRCKQVLDDLKGKKRIVEIERGSTRSNSLVNSH
jgi:chromosome segregation and condensation protein ScpB